MRTLIYKYEIENRIGYFVFDNISSNDICVRELLSHIKSNISSKHRRLRCFGYIINLAVKLFLWGSDSELFEIEAKLFKKLEQVKKELYLQRKCGPAGKLHNIAVYINKTSQRRETFLETVPAVGNSKDI